MPPLLVVPAPDLATGDLDARTLASLPPMPELDALLRGAEPLPPDDDWRRAVLGDLAWPAGVPRAAPAVVASWATEPVGPGAALCFATPLHLVAGISRVHLPPGGILALAEAERAELAAQFQAAFPEVPLHRAGESWLLEAPFAGAAADPDPARLVGRALERTAAGDARQRDLRRFGAEVEMWLASLPLNRDRERRGVPVVNALWFWGGGAWCAPPAGLRPVQWCCADAADAWLAGLAHGGPAPRTHCAQWPVDAGPLAAVLDAPAGGLHAALPGWDARWFGPARAALAGGAIDELRLRIGARGWRVRRRRWRWPWQGRRPWWQQVAA